MQLMLGKIARAVPNAVGVCGTCMDARGMKGDELMEGAHRGTLDELAQWSEQAEQVFVF